MAEQPENDPLRDFFRRDDTAVPAAPPHELRAVLKRVEARRSPFYLPPTVWTPWLLPVAAAAAVVLALGPGLWRPGSGDASFLPDDSIVLEYPDDTSEEDEGFGEEWLAIAHDVQ